MALVAADFKREMKFCGKRRKEPWIDDAIIVTQTAIPQLLGLFIGSISG